MVYVVLAGIVVLLIFIFRSMLFGRKWKSPSSLFPNEWRSILIKKVGFYKSLDKKEKQAFEYKVQEFLLNCRITGIGVEIDDTDSLLVAASAIIPIFRFPEWKYQDLYEVLIYPGMFNEDYEVAQEDSDIMGMVGEGPMEGKMILSKRALHYGFENELDKKNTAIHEFIHLIDMADGNIDGVPMALMEKQYAIPWIDLINKKIEEIYNEESDINHYGASNKSEFFAVAGEYFFGRPKLLAKKHPVLYKMLEEIFNQDMKSRKLRTPKREIGRNDPCPCNSGKKFKKCCGKRHYRRFRKG